MNKEQIIDEVYRKYADSHKYFVDGWMHVIPMEHSKESFINKCKTNPEFSNKWGIKIEERELTRDERIDLYCKEHTPGIRGKYEPPFDNFIDAKLTTRNISTRLITLTYKNETIESYK